MLWWWLTCFLFFFYLCQRGDFFSFGMYLSFSKELRKCFSTFFFGWSMDFFKPCISHCELWFYYSSSVLVPVGPSLCGALWLAALSLWHHVESCILQNSLPFIVITVCVCPSVSSILLMGPVMTYSFLLLAFLLLPESLCACLVCYYPFPTLSKEDKACD